MQKTKNWIFSSIFSTCPSRPKFYYITHLCEIGLTRKFNFFKNVIKIPCIFFSIINFTSKICSFEVHYVDLAQKITKWEGDDYCKFTEYAPCPSLNFWVASTKFTSKEHIFHTKLISKKNMHFFTVEILKKIKFSSWPFFT